MPFGVIPDEWIQEWASHLRSTYGIDVRVVAPVDALDAWDQERQQVLAEGAISVVQREYEAALVDHDAAFIIVTELDMYTKDVEPFIFGITQSSRFGIVSGYHMDPVHRGAHADESLLRGRMLKLITKYVGITYLRLPETKNTSSLMYGPINSIAILDSLPAELAAAASR